MFSWQYMNINVLSHVLLHFGNHRIYITTESNFQVNPARAIKCDCKTIFQRPTFIVPFHLSWYRHYQ